MKPLLCTGALAAVALLGACASAPESYLTDREVFYHANMYRYPVRVEAIDSSGNTFSPAPITPGVHRVLIAAAPVAGFRDPIEKTYVLNIAPCSKYYLAADRQNNLTQDWQLVVERVDRVAQCDPAAEERKAQADGVAPARPDASVIVGG